MHIQPTHTPVSRPRSTKRLSPAKLIRTASALCALPVVAAGRLLSAAPSPLVAPTPAPGGGPLFQPNAPWQWRDVPGAVCGNGDATGFAVNLQPNSRDLMVYFEGGGDCDSFVTCDILHSAAHVTDGYNQATFNSSDELGHLQNGLAITNRNDTANPFRAMNYAYVPYCTGDLHAGNNTVQYDPDPRDVHHVGAVNAALYLGQLATLVPDPQRVFMVGSSAGGFGAIFNLPRANATWSTAQLYGIDDSGIAFAGNSAPSSWNVTIPGDCNCSDDFSKLLTYTANQYPQAHLALTSYSFDDVLPEFEKTSPGDWHDQLEQFRSRADHVSNLRYFYAQGTGHETLDDLTLQAADGTSQGAFLQALVNNQSQWKSHS